MTDQIPLAPNIQEFNEITAVIFTQLYVAFPADRSLDPAEIASVLGISTTEKLASGRSFNEIFAHTLSRLIREGFIDSYGTYPRERCVLTTKAMAVMGVIPPKLKEPFATELNNATTAPVTEDRKNKIAGLMGDFFGSFAGSLWKSMGN